MNFGYNLLEQELLSYNEQLNFCKQESLEDLLKDNLADFKALYQHHMDEIHRELASIDEAAQTKIQTMADSSSLLMSHQIATDAEQPAGQSADVAAMRETVASQMQMTSEMPKATDSSAVGIVVLSDKKSMKPLWTSTRFEDFKTVLGNPDAPAYIMERRLLLNGLVNNLQPVMRDHVRKRANHRIVKRLSSNMQGAYV